MIWGLLAALGWGSADLGATVGGRRIGSFPTVIIAQAFSALATTVILLASGRGIDRLGSIIWILVVNGVVTSSAYYMHYRALELGPMVVVSPIGASYAVVGVALAIVILDERPGLLALVGAIVTIGGVMLTSTDLPKLRAGTHGRPPGLWWAVGAAICFGIAAFTLGRAAQLVGWVPGLWASRIAQVICFAPLVVVRRREFVGLAAAGVGLALLTGLADLLGVVTYSIGSERGYLSIVLAASAVFPMIAVAGSVAFLGERPVSNQYVGVAIAALGLLLLGRSAA
ncbi:MAG: DMT family transporter [Actinomycetota bacterium]